MVLSDCYSRTTTNTTKIGVEMAFVDTIRTLFGLVSDGPEPLKRARRKRKQPDEGADDDDGSDGEAQPQYRRRRRTLRIRRPSVTSFAAAPRNRVHGGAKAGAGVGADVTSTIASVPDSRRGGGGDGATGPTKTSSGVDTGVVQHLRRHKDMNAFGLRQSTYMRQQRVRYGLPPTLALPEDASSDVEGSPESQASPSSRPAIDWTPAPSAAPQRVDTTPRPQGSAPSPTTHCTRTHVHMTMVCTTPTIARSAPCCVFAAWVIHASNAQQPAHTLPGSATGRQATSSVIGGGDTGTSRVC